MLAIERMKRLVAGLVYPEQTPAEKYSGFDDPELEPVYRAIATNRDLLLFYGPATIQYSRDDCLLPGIYRLSWSEFESTFGSGSRKRQALLAGLRAQLALLAEAGCKRVYVGGSFASKKRVPGDFDAVYDLDGLDCEHVRRLEPRLLMESPADAEALKNDFGGAVEPLRIYPSVGFSLLEILQFDTRTGNLKGLVEIEIA